MAGVLDTLTSSITWSMPLLAIVHIDFIMSASPMPFLRCSVRTPTDITWPLLCPSMHDIM